MKFLYTGSFGSEDPTRAGLTFVMAKPPVPIIRETTSPVR